MIIEEREEFRLTHCVFSMEVKWLSFKKKRGSKPNLEKSTPEPELNDNEKENPN